MLTRRFVLVVVMLLLIGGGIFYFVRVPEPIVLAGPVSCSAETFAQTHTESAWTPEQIASLCSLWIGNLPPLEPNPTNPYADDEAAARLGQRLFFDTQFSANGDIACVTCHQPDKNFTDGLPKPVGGGPRKSQTIVGIAYSPWFFWDGHKDSLWAQALEPIESPVEHNFGRNQLVEILATDTAYRAEYEAVFGAMPDPASEAATTEIFVNFGKAIAAYERKILPAPAPFDTYVQAVLAQDSATMRYIYDADETAGLEIFLGEGQCTRCHNSPLLTNNEFHGTGVFEFVDYGRVDGAALVLNDAFRCGSDASGVSAETCDDLRFIRTEGIELEGAFKTPTLRNIAEAAPYTHTGLFPDLASMLTHYNNGGRGMVIGEFGHNELNVLNLSAEQLSQLEAFLRTLSGGVSAEQSFLEPLP